MATTKKKVAPKKTTTKKRANSNTASTKKTSSASKSAASDFWQVRFTINTVYWLIIGAAVISTALITYNTNQQINDIYDRIELDNAATESTMSRY